MNSNKKSYSNAFIAMVLSLMVTLQACSIRNCPTYKPPEVVEIPTEFNVDIESVRPYLTKSLPDDMSSHEGATVPEMLARYSGALDALKQCNMDKTSIYNILNDQ